jgi:hypothetical protein
LQLLSRITAILLASLFLTTPLAAGAYALEASAVSSPTVVSTTERLLIGAERWAAGNGTKALFVNEYDNWAAHSTTDGTSWVWFPENAALKWKEYALLTLSEAGMQVTTAADIPSDISGYDLVIISSLYACEPRHVAQVASFINDGGGVILLGMVPEFFRCYNKSHHTWYQSTDPLSANNYQWMGFAQHANTGGSAYLTFENAFGSGMDLGTLLFVGGQGLASYEGVTDVTGSTWAQWDTGVTFAVSNSYGSGRFYYQAELTETPIDEPKAHAYGQVLAPNDYPLATASAAVDSQLASQCDNTGNFNLTAAPGVHNVTISAPGYHPVTVQVALIQNELLNMGKFHLTVDAAEMGLTRLANGNGYSLLVPQAWSRNFNVTVGGSLFDLQLLGPQAGSVTKNILLQHGKDDTISSLESEKYSFLNETIKGLADQGITAFVHEQPSISDLGGDQCMVFSLQYSGYPVLQKIGVVMNQSTHRYWILTCTTADSTYDEDAPMFDAVIQSFQVQGEAETNSYNQVLIGIAVVAVIGVVCAATVVGFDRIKKRKRRP